MFGKIKGEIFFPIYYKLQHEKVVNYIGVFAYVVHEICGCMDATTS